MPMQALGLVWGNLDPVNADLEEERVPIEFPSQFGARLLLDHWRARDGGMGFIVGRDVPSRPLAGVLRNLALYEPIDELGDFRLRLAGTAFMRRFGRDVTGLKLSDIYDARTFARERVSLLEIVDKKFPEIFDVKMTCEGRVFQQFEALRLPVISPDRKETWVMGALFYSDWS